MGTTFMKGNSNLSNKLEYALKDSDTVVIDLIYMIRNKKIDKEAGINMIVDRIIKMVFLKFRDTARDGDIFTYFNPNLHAIVYSIIMNGSENAFKRKTALQIIRDDLNICGYKEDQCKDLITKIEATIGVIYDEF